MVVNKGLNPEEHYVYLHCSCRDHTHTVRANMWDSINDPVPTVWVTFDAPIEHNFWKRLINSVKYLLGKPVVGGFGEVVWDASIVPQLREITKYLERPTNVSDK